MIRVEETTQEQLTHNGGPLKAERPRAWIVVCKGLGLINIIAESAEKLVERLNTERRRSAAAVTPLLIPFDVLDNTPDGNQAVIWFDPALAQAVINEYRKPQDFDSAKELRKFEQPWGPRTPEVAVVVVDPDKQDNDG